MAGPRCTVCDHSEKDAIDRALIAGTSSLRNIASQYGLVHTSVNRHKAHLPQRVAKAAARRAEKAEDTFMEGVLSGMAAARQGVEFGMSKAQEVAPELAYRLTPGFLAQQARYLELLGNATGRLNVPAAGQVGVFVSINMPGVTKEPQAPAIDVTASTVEDDNE